VLHDLHDGLVLPALDPALLSGRWSNPSDLTQAGDYEIAEVLIYDRAVADSEILTRHSRSKACMAGFGEAI
jgi:hypothetical protein